MVTGIVGVASLLAGCGPSDHELTRSDFAGQPAPAKGALLPPTTLPATAGTPPKRTPPGSTGYADPALGSGSGVFSDEEVFQALKKMPKPSIVAAKPEGYTMDAMVGQVNGNAIYASAVFEPFSEQLAALGKTLPRPSFSDKAKQLISSRLDSIVADALILGQAERDLNEQERMGLEVVMREKRDELLRKYGEGSEAVANERSMAREGKTIDKQLQEEREKLLVQRFLKQKLFIKINVTRADIDRYYAANYDTYNHPASRSLRIIRSTLDNAGKIDRQLADGKLFSKVASSSLNQFHSDSGGLMSDRVEGDSHFEAKELNDAMVKLKVGEHSPRIVVGDSAWWIQVESYEPPRNRPLQGEVQLEIEELLRKQRFQALSLRYRTTLYETGSFNPVDQMTDSLLAVAVSRYAMPQ